MYYGVVKTMITRKTAGTAENPAHPQILLHDIQINVTSISMCNIRSPAIQHASDLDFDLLRSPKLKCDGVTGLPIYDFLLMFNSNIWPVSAL